jgi:hypothetical protein
MAMVTASPAALLVEPAAARTVVTVTVVTVTGPTVTVAAASLL